MFAQLGKTQFENLKTPEEYSKRGEAIYAEHALIDGKPKLQRTGSSLEELNISIRLHASFCNPKEELDSLITARNEGEIMPLLWGNGILEGDFVITELEHRTEDADPQGNVFSYFVSLVLKEYVAKTKLHQEQDENKKNAKAVGDKKPIAKKKSNPLTCPQVITSNINRIENHGALVNRYMLERGGPNTVTNKTTMVSSLNAIVKLADDLKARCENPNSCAYDNVDLKSKSVTVSARAYNMAFSINSDGTDLSNDNVNLQAAIKALKAAGRSFVNQTITRK